MNKLKDIIYDKNDLLVALIIILIAGFVIYERIDTIMTYPSALAAEAEVNAAIAGNPNDDPIISHEESPGTGDSDADGENDADVEGQNDTDAENNDTNTEKGNEGQNSTEGQTHADNSDSEDSPSVRLVTITINPGSLGSHIAQILLDAGLIKSTGEFYNAVALAGADTKLKAGTFKIPSNATPAEIVNIITN